MGPPSSAASAPVRPPYQGRRPIGSGHVSATLVARARPTSSRRDQLLPVLPALAPLMPDGGLQRGGVVAVDVGAGPARDPAGDPGPSGAGGAGGGTTLAFALLAAASATSWCAAVGTADPGIVALAELGVDLRHLVLVPRPGALWPQVTATLLDGVDAVLLRLPGSVRPEAARRLAARVRERRAVLVVLAPARGWPEAADVRLSVQAGGWQGVGSGHGHLQARRALVVATGRRAATRPVGVELWLPAPSGRIEAVDGRTTEETVATEETMATEETVGTVATEETVGNAQERRAHEKSTQQNASEKNA